jgi:hypothetical protein
LADAGQPAADLASEHALRPRRPSAGGPGRPQPGRPVPAHRPVHHAGDLRADRPGDPRRRRRAARRHHRHLTGPVPGPGRGGRRRVAGRRVGRLPARPQVRRPAPHQPPRPPAGCRQLGQGRAVPQRPRRPGGVRRPVRGRGPRAAAGGRRRGPDALPALRRLGRGRLAGLVGAVRGGRRGRRRLLAPVRRAARPGRLPDPRRPGRGRAAGPEGSPTPHQRRIP